MEQTLCNITSMTSFLTIQTYVFNYVNFTEENFSKNQCQPLGQGDIGHYDEQQTNTI